MTVLLAENRRTVERMKKAAGPLYVRVANALKHEIVRGDHPVGARLPTEAALSARFEVSRQTVREALRRLREDHLVSSKQGAGTVVVCGGVADGYAQDVMSINDLVSWAVGKRFAIAAMDTIALDDALAERTRLSCGESWLAVRGFGYEADLSAPVCFAEYYIRRDFAAVGRLLPRHTGPIFPLIEDLFGVKVSEVHQEIGATALSAELASVLKVRTGSPALEIRRSYRLPNRQVAQVTLSTHPVAHYRHAMTLRRLKR